MSRPRENLVLFVISCNETLNRTLVLIPCSKLKSCLVSWATNKHIFHQTSSVWGLTCPMPGFNLASQDWTHSCHIPFCHVSKSPVVLYGSVEQHPLSSWTRLLFPVNWFQQPSTVSRTVGNDLNELRASSLRLLSHMICSHSASHVYCSGRVEGESWLVLLFPESLQFFEKQPVT